MKPFESAACSLDDADDASGDEDDGRQAGGQGPGTNAPARSAPSGIGAIPVNGAKRGRRGGRGGRGLQRQRVGGGSFPPPLPGGVRLDPAGRWVSSGMLGTWGAGAGRRCGGGFRVLGGGHTGFLQERPGQNQAVPANGQLDQLPVQQQALVHVAQRPRTLRHSGGADLHVRPQDARRELDRPAVLNTHPPAGCA